MAYVPKPRYPLQRKKKRKGESATTVHVLLALAGVVVVVTIAIASLRYYRNLAYGIAAQNSLTSFVSAQQNYFEEHDRFLGQEGDFIEAGNPPVSTFPGPPTFDFVPIAGVRIDIVSGNGARREGPHFRAKATHEKAQKQYVYDFNTRTMEETRTEP
ncbi:MAG: hypothetical protein ABSF35_16600 [Polyangia bacterium]|jgi:hypothetical protein